MPRGRHRHSTPLHRLLPALTVAGSGVVLAVGAWFIPGGDHQIVLRGLVTAAAASAAAGALLLRRWDQSAGLRVAELEAARVRDEWHAEERVAELEGEADEAREERRRAEAKLRAQHSELARLRSEHAELLKRYATAESERARALEGRRVLAIEAAATPRALSPSRPTSGRAVSPAAYLKAAQALRSLGRNGARQHTTRTTGADRGPDFHGPDGDKPRGKREPRGAGPAPAGSFGGRSAVPPAVAVRPYTQPRAPRPPAGRMQGGFDFFGMGGPADPVPPTGRTEAANGADAVGPDAVRAETVGAEVAVRQPAQRQDGAEVIDLTVHDETEPIDVPLLRATS